MPNDRELLQQTFDFFSQYIKINEIGQDELQAEAEIILNAIQARLAQPEPEPVAWMKNDRGHIGFFDAQPNGYIPLYTAPLKKEWVGLTDEEYEAMAEQYVTNCYFDTLKYAHAIEKSLREKNQ